MTTRWTGLVSPNANGGFVALGDYLELQQALMCLLDAPENSYMEGWEECRRRICGIPS